MLISISGLGWVVGSSDNPGVGFILLGFALFVLYGIFYLGRD